MSDTLEKKTVEEKTAAKIEAYLQGPRKKRKNYVVLAIGDAFERDVVWTLESYVRRTFPNLAVSFAKSSEELTRQFNRNISLLIIADTFTDRTETMRLVRLMKDKRREESIPVLFLTRDGEALIKAYHKDLLVYNESDDYVVMPDSSMPQVFASIKKGIEAKNRRKSRRYPVDIGVTYYHLTHDQQADARIIDISMHGALITADPSTIFKLGDQIKISVPISDYMRLNSGDFIRISGRVRRVFISGNQVALSFEHVSEQQSRVIGQLILALAGRYLQGQTNRLKAQTASSTQNKPG